MTNAELIKKLRAFKKPQRGTRHMRSYALGWNDALDAAILIASQGDVEAGLRELADNAPDISNIGTPDIGGPQ